MKKGLIIYAIISLMLFAVGIGLGNTFSEYRAQSRQYSFYDEGAGVSWKSYVSEGLNISFEYPSSWRVEEQKSDYWEGREVVSLSLYPPEDELELSIKPEVSNVITFYSEDRLLDPLVYYTVDEATFFNEWEYLMQRNYLEPFSESYDGYMRVMKYSPGAGGYLGLYRDGPENMIGIRQWLCNKVDDKQCALIFRRILESVQFLEE